MKKIKKLSILLITALLVCTSVLLGSCGTGEMTYKVTVKDSLGNPYSSGIVVRFLQDGAQVAMQACDASGVAAAELAKGDYTVELTFTDGEDAYYYDKNLTLTADASELDVILSNKITSEPETLYVGAGEYDAYSVSAGSTYVELTPNERTYLLFAPSTAGNYEFSVKDGSNTRIGYYGAPHFVQENSAAEAVDNTFTISIKSSMIGTGDGGTSIYVIGIDSLDADTTSCILGIERIGDPIKTVEDEPWTVYQKTAELVEYQLPASAEIKEFDLTAATDTYNLVYNEEDGFYHLDSTSGPLVLVRLAEDSDYIASFQTMLDRSGIVKYFFDEAGEFVRKESYSECLLEYIECADEAEGVYPLTEDLKYIIQQRGDYVGWWDIENSGYLFKDINGNNDPGINADIAWLLMCCYIG